MTKTTNAQKKRSAKPRPKVLTVGDLVGVRGGMEEDGADGDCDRGGKKLEPDGFEKTGLA